MRSTNTNALPNILTEHPLMGRGGALRTFGGLALLLVLALLVIGAYMIEEQFTNPLASQSLSLFASAVLLSSAMALLYELIQVPRRFRKEESLGGKRMLSMAAQAVPASRQVRGDAKRPNPARTRVAGRRDLAYQRCYVDRVRVRA
jgi:hypothetical protein